MKFLLPRYVVPVFLILSGLAGLPSHAGSHGTNAPGTREASGTKQAQSFSQSLPLSVSKSRLATLKETASKLEKQIQDLEKEVSSRVAVGNPIVAQGRLTLETAVPVSTTDQTAKTTLYYTPFHGSWLTLYDGSSTWKLFRFTEVSLALGTLANATNYDVFAYNSSGTVTLEFSAAWTNNTTRATALTTQNGVYVKSGATTRLYLGTIRTTSTTTTEDSLAKRFVWNAYNRRCRPLYVNDTTDSWTHDSTTIRQARGQAANQVEIVNGLREESISVWAEQIAEGVGDPRNMIGENSTTAKATNCSAAQDNNGSTVPLMTSLLTIPGLGYTYYAWLEATAGATATFYGDAGSAWSNGGISALWCN